ncbi:MAG: hypothetical protein GF308_00730 [Candidatus Heimdallarchaeota archaeon]|nr:hypothetical protein [Candidatus Heimdallarchaeota archaeon]
MKELVLEGKKATGERFRKTIKSTKASLYLKRRKLVSLDLSPLEQCNKLQTFSLSQNRLTSIDLHPLEKCSALQGLFLNDNQLTDINLIPLQRCFQLKILDLRNNPLSAIDLSSLASCSQLSLLSFDSSTTIRWEKPSLALNKLPRGLQTYREEIQRAWKQHTARQKQGTRTQRSEKLRMILKKCQEMSLERMSRLLAFENSDLLFDWLLDLPEEYGIQIKDEKVFFTKDLQSKSSETEAAISSLLEKFEEFEKSHRETKV